MPPTLSVSNTDSLGEQIQRAFPDARVVKALNTVNALVMVDPARVPGDHDLFVGRVAEVRFDPAHYDASGLFVGEAAVYLGRSAYVTTTPEREVYPPEVFGD